MQRLESWVSRQDCTQLPQRTHIRSPTPMEIHTWSMAEDRFQVPRFCNCFLSFHHFVRCYLGMGALGFEPRTSCNLGRCFTTKLSLLKLFWDKTLRSCLAMSSPCSPSRTWTFFSPCYSLQCGWNYRTVPTHGILLGEIRKVTHVPWFLPSGT